MVSIIIRSFNDIPFIGKTMEGIAGQRFRDFELVNVDSGSTDGTFEVVGKYNRNIVYRNRPEDYVPGKVLNEAVGKCGGDIVVFNNSDCIPLNGEWLENLVRPLLEDDNVAAAFANQVPRKSAWPFIRREQVRAYGDGKAAAGWRHFFSLASSAVRRSVVTRFPFNGTIRYSEDIEWSYRMKGKGYGVVYVPDALVEHSHNYSFGQARRRYYGEGRAEGEIYGQSKNVLRDVLVPFAAESARDTAYCLARLKPFSLPRAIAYRAVQKYQTYRGTLDYLREHGA